MLFVVNDLEGNVVKNIPLKDVDRNNMSEIWGLLNDGEYVIQIKSTVVPILHSNSLSIVIEDKTLIMVSDADDENKSILWKFVEEE